MKAIYGMYPVLPAPQERMSPRGTIKYKTKKLAPAIIINRIGAKISNSFIVRFFFCRICPPSLIYTRVLTTNEFEILAPILLLVIRFMADLLRKYRGSVVIMVGRGGAEPHYVHN